MFRRVGRVGLIAVLAALGAGSVGCQEARESIDVLFVGNSYIYFNNLPGMIESLSTALDGPIVRGVGHTHGGETLRGHIDDGHVSDLLAEGPERGGSWDRVVLQEQSTLGTEYDRENGVLGSPDDFYAAARELTEMVRAAGITPTLYMTWAKESFPAQTEVLSRAYRSIGSELGVGVVPVGEAWAEALRLRPGFGLHLGDGSHPNAAGSYLAACVFYAVLTGRSPIGAPRELIGMPWNFAGEVESSTETMLVSLSAADAEFLQGVAADVTGTHRSGAGE